MGFLVVLNVLNTLNLYRNIASPSYQKLTSPQKLFVTYALRQLKFPLNNINRLAYHLSVSTGTFVILCVIPDQV